MNDLPPPTTNSASAVPAHSARLKNALRLPNGLSNGVYTIHLAVGRFAAFSFADNDDDENVTGTITSLYTQVSLRKKSECEAFSPTHVDLSPTRSWGRRRNRKTDSRIDKKIAFFLCTHAMRRMEARKNERDPAGILSIRRRILIKLNSSRVSFSQKLTRKLRIKMMRFFHDVVF